jgi:hypothetical protein
MTAAPPIQDHLDADHMRPPLPISLQVADEGEVIEDSTWRAGAQHPGPSGTSLQQHLDILRDEWGNANREPAAGFFLVCAAAVPT